MRRVDDPFTVFDFLAFGVLATAIAAVAVLDLVTAARFVALAWNPPAVHEIEARARDVPASRGQGHGAALSVAAPDGRLLLTTGPSTVMGRARSGVDAMRVDPEIVAKVAWIDAPATLPAWTTHYPIRVEQAGHVLRAIEGAAGIAREELPGVLTEAALCGLFCAGTLWPLVARRRSDRRRIADARAAWQGRRAR